MLTGNITFTGRTPADVQDAIREALTRIEDDNTSGMDRNEDGSFIFTVDGTDETPADVEDGAGGS